MTPEERLAKIENAIRDLIVVSRTILDSQKGVENTLHEHDVSLKKMEEMQIVLMESQNATFRAIDRLTENIQRLIQGRGPNGNT